MAIQPIRIVIQGIDKFSSTIGQSQKRIEKFGKSMSRVGRTMTAGLTLPIVAFGASAVQSTTKFETAMNKVEALTQASTGQMNQMRSVAKKLGMETQFSASEAADAMGFLGMAGWQTNDILKGTPHLLNLAAASQTELARTADIASNIMGAFGIEASETNRVADILAATTASSNVNLEMLAESFKDAGPIAKVAGASLKDTAVAIGFLGNIGIQGSKSGTALKNMFTRLASPVGKAAGLLEDLGIKVSDAEGNMRPYANILGELSGKMVNLGSQQKIAVLDELFGKRVIAGASALTNDITKVNSGFKQLSQALSNVDGRAQSMAETMMKGAPGAFKRLTSAWEGLMIAIGESGLLNAVAVIVEKLVVGIRKLAGVSPRLMKLGVIFAGVVAAIGPLLMILGPIVVLVAKLSGAIASAGGVIALLSNPIGWVIAGIVALTAVIVAMKTKFGLSMKSMFAGLMFLSGPIGWIVAIFIKNWSKILPFLKLIGIGFVVLGKLAMYVLWPVFKLLEVLGGILGWVTGLLLDLLSVLTRLVLPKWLEQKIGLTPGETAENFQAESIAGRAGVVNKNENETKITIEDRAGVNLKTETQKGTVDTQVMRGLGFQGAY